MGMWLQYNLHKDTNSNIGCVAILEKDSGTKESEE
jgi:hypothetical protein